MTPGEVGVFPNITNADYHSNPAISKSGLDRIRKSPAHFQTWKNTPHKQTPDQEIGTVVHTMVLEPETEGEVYIRIPDDLVGVARRGKANLEKWADFDKEAGSRIQLKPERWRQARDMADAVMDSQKARFFLEGEGHTERSFFWTDPQTGVMCRCRPDRERPHVRALVDLKTTQDASVEKFSYSVWDWRYHVQGAFYLDGANAVLGPGTYDNFVLIAVEKTPPYGVTVNVLHPDDIQQGREEYQEDLAKYAECQSRSEWPGYRDTVNNLRLPRYRRKVKPVRM